MTKKYNAVKSKRDAITAHLGLDLADLKDYVYHYGLTTQIVYAFSDAYYCVTRHKESPAKHRENENRWKWVKQKDDFIKQDGYYI